MRDESSLRRLAEIGIDVYVLRTPSAPETGESPAMSRPAEVSARSADSAAPRIVVLANGGSATGVRVLGDVERAFRVARVRCSFTAEASEETLADAAALVAFGESHARAAGACLPSRRQDEMGWVVVAEAAAFAGNAAAKRALWSELKRIMRPLRADRVQPR